MQKWLLYIQIPNLISRCVLREIPITLCFVLADDLHINILEFVAGRGTVVHSVSIIIVFGCKQAQQYSRTYQLVLSELSVGVHKMLNRIVRTCISLLQQNTSVFMHFIRSVGWVTAWFDVLFKSHNVTKTMNIFLAHFRFLKKLQIFSMLLGIIRAAPLPKSPLISSYQQEKHLA